MLITEFYVEFLIFGPFRQQPALVKTRHLFLDFLIKQKKTRERHRDKGASNRLFFVAWTRAVGLLAVWEGFRANYSQRIPPTPQITKL